MTLKILDPVQEPRKEVFELAPRLATLDGKVLGLYSNEKLNATRLLEMIAEELSQHFNFRIKSGWYHPAELMDNARWQGLEECDVIILANGDCGACSSSGIANTIAIEKRGIPAFLISTPPFYDAVRTMADTCGMPDVKWAVVDHPIGNLKEPELRQRARSAAEQFLTSMLRAPAEPRLAMAAGA